jgi:hypothetical protein
MVSGSYYHVREVVILSKHASQPRKRLLSHASVPSIGWASSKGGNKSDEGDSTNKDESEESSIANDDAAKEGKASKSNDKYKFHPSDDPLSNADDQKTFSIAPNLSVMWMTNIKGRI